MGSNYITWPAFVSRLCPFWKKLQWSFPSKTFTHKQLETHVCIISNVDTDGLVLLKHQAICIHNAVGLVCGMYCTGLVSYQVSLYSQHYQKIKLHLEVTCTIVYGLKHLVCWIFWKKHQNNILSLFYGLRSECLIWHQNLSLSYCHP